MDENVGDAKRTTVFGLNSKDASRRGVDSNNNGEQILRLPQSELNRSPLSVASRGDLTTNIKRWVQLDSQLKLINERTKLMRDERSNLSNEICKGLDSAGIANRKIILPDGDLKVYERKEYSPLTFGFLEQHLGKIMTDPQQVSFVIDYLKQQRDITATPDLKRSYTR